MAKGFKHGAGGGTSLNFNVICNPQPETAKENTIWVDTDRINNYYFSATQPENMAEYDVWFLTGTSSTVAFSATKKPPIIVYPLSAKQYVGGAWVNKEAMSFQNGVWVDWVDHLFKAGSGALVEFTLGKEQNAVTPTITKDAFLFTENSSGTYNWAYAITEEPIDVTDISVIYVKAKVTSASKNLYLGTTNSNSNPTSPPSDGYTNMQTASVETVYSFRVDGLSGNRYVKMIGNNGATITDIWYE